MTQMLHSSSKPYENHHLILDHIDSHLSQDLEDHIPHYYKKSTPISSTSSPEPMHHHHIHPHHVYQQQFRVIKDGRQVYEESGGYQVSSSGGHHGMDTKPIEMAPPSSTQKVKIICSEEPTSSMPDLGEFFFEFFWLENFQTKSIIFFAIPLFREHYEVVVVDEGNNMCEDYLRGVAMRVICLHFKNLNF